MSEIKCPKCNSPMKLRAGKFGKFYGCSAFPNCRGIVPFGDKPQNFDKEIVVIKSRWVAPENTMEFSINGDKVADWKYSDGKVVSKNGAVLDGVVNSYFPSGSLKAEITFVNNEMSGPYEEYDESGKVVQKGNYENGEKKVSFKSGEEPYAVDASSSDTVQETADNYLDAPPVEEFPSSEQTSTGKDDDFVPDDEDEDLPF